MIKKFLRRILVKKLTWEEIEQNLTQLKFSCADDLEKWQEEAKKGNQVAINIVAELGYYAHKETSLEMFQILSDHHYAPAQLTLGLIYMGGKDLAKDIKKGFSLIKKSAVPGYAPGIYQLGLCYKNGMGTAIDKEKYLENMRKAQNLDYPDAYNELGEFYFADESAQDFNLSYKLIDRASKLGFVPAYYRLSQFHLNGLGDVTQDVVQAFIWLTIALKDANAKNSEDQDKVQMEENFNAVKTLKGFLTEKDLAEVMPVITAIEQRIKEERGKNKWLNLI